jgi:transcription initiation factor TFIID subunit 2
VPCVDNLWERCTWEFEFVVPRSLDLDGESTTGPNYNVVVVCSGEFQQQIVHPLDPEKVIFLFEQQALTSVQHISWVAGPFYVMPITTNPTTTSARTDPTSEAMVAAGQPRMHAFCLPGHERHLMATAGFLPQAMRHFIQEVGSYPFNSFKLVFVDDLVQSRHDGATICLASIDLLHTEDAIDPVFETRMILSQAVAIQWFGINIFQKTWSDSWLVNGLASYITASFIRRHFGNNEYRFRLKKDILRVVEMDVGEMPPICQPGLLEPTDAAFRQFVNLKAPLVLHILDRRMHKTGTSQGLHRIIPKIILDALENENAAAISTHSFLRMCRKTAGLDFRPFAEQWIYGSGCPRFTVRSHFNRKKMAVEMHVKQESPAFEANKDDPVTQALLRPMPFFDGQMTIRIHEADGTPYEHVLDIRQPYKKFEVPFNTKYKRVRRNTKRFIARQMAAEAAGNPETAELIGVVDMSFGLGIWEDDASREDWKVADWTEADEAHMATATYEWIRLDTDIEWLTKISFDQEPFMWVSQLSRDRDVIAQIEVRWQCNRSAIRQIADKSLLSLSRPSTPFLAYHQKSFPVHLPRLC